MRTVHPSLSLHCGWWLSALYDITKGMQLLCELTKLTDMFGLCSALVQTANISNQTPSPPQNTIIERYMWSLSRFKLSHQCRQSLHIHLWWHKTGQGDTTERLDFSIECFPYNRPSCGWHDPQHEQKLDLFWRICFCSSTFCDSVHLSTCTV